MDKRSGPVYVRPLRILPTTVPETVPTIVPAPRQNHASGADISQDTGRMEILESKRFRPKNADGRERRERFSKPPPSASRPPHRRLSSIRDAGICREGHRREATVLKTGAFDHKWLGPEYFAALQALEVCPTRPGTLLGTLGPISLTPTRILERKRGNATVFQIVASVKESLDLTMRSPRLLAHSGKGIENPKRADGVRCASLRLSDGRSQPKRRTAEPRSAREVDGVCLMP